MVAPRWKTLIQRFRRKKNNQHPSVDGGWRTRSAARFQYDPMSYALNFDEGPEDGSPNGAAQLGYRDFSARFAAPPPA